MSKMSLRLRPSRSFLVQEGEVFIWETKVLIAEGLGCPGAYRTEGLQVLDGISNLARRILMGPDPERSGQTRILKRDEIDHNWRGSILVWEAKVAIPGLPGRPGRPSWTARKGQKPPKGRLLPPFGKSRPQPVFCTEGVPEGQVERQNCRTARVADAVVT